MHAAWTYVCSNMDTNKHDLQLACSNSSMAGAWMAAMIAASARSAPWWAKLSIYKVTMYPTDFQWGIVQSWQQKQQIKVMNSWIHKIISMNWTMLAASSYAVRIPWGCSIPCPTSPCCLEMATVLMKGLHLRCAPIWELSIRVLDLFVKTFGMDLRQIDATIDQILQQLSKRLPRQHHSKHHFSQYRPFPRRNHSPKIIGSCANSGETKRADAVSQRHGGPFSMRHWHSKIKEVP